VLQRRDAAAFSRNTRSKRLLADPFIQSSPIRLGSVGSGRASLARDSPSGHGGEALLH
jgi:hypothetical protein